MKIVHHSFVAAFLNDKSNFDLKAIQSSPTLQPNKASVFSQSTIFQHVNS